MKKQELNKQLRENYVTKSKSSPRKRTKNKLKKKKKRTKRKETNDMNRIQRYAQTKY